MGGQEDPAPRSAHRGSAVPGRARGGSRVGRDQRRGRDEIERVFREDYGRAVSLLVRVFGDIDLAEEAVQDAFAMAVERGRATACPRVPPDGSSRPHETAQSTASVASRSREDRHAQAGLAFAADGADEEGACATTSFA